MSDLPGNQHYEAAVTNSYAGDMRFTEATLALAWEQRTANLQRERDSLNEAYGMGELNELGVQRLHALQREVMTRLGL